MAEDEDEVRAAAGQSERPRSDEIREDIERTRMELEETVDELGNRLKPRRMAQEGWQAVKSSGEQGANRLVRIAREHPIPMGLIGVGVTWLVIESRRRSGDWTDYEVSSEDYSEFAGEGTYGAGEGRLASAKEKVAGAAERVQDRASDAAHRAGEMASRAGSRVGEFASQAGSRVGEFASQAGSKVSSVADNVRHKAVDLGQRTGHQVRRAREGYWDMVERRPIAAGLATLAVGLLAGLLIPTTRRERRLMGETRDELLRGARDASQRTLEKTKEVARTAMDAAGNAAQSEAQRQNLPTL
jgi:hypothetical protein